MTNRSPQKRRFRSVSIFWLLPNMLTIAGLVSGLTALRFALDGRWAGVIVLIAVAAVFDASDASQAFLELNFSKEILCSGIRLGQITLTFGELQLNLKIVKQLWLLIIKD